MSKKKSDAIGSQISTHPSETDIAALQAAEKSIIGKPVPVWFHADW